MYVIVDWWAIYKCLSLDNFPCRSGYRFELCKWVGFTFLICDAFQLKIKISLASRTFSIQKGQISGRRFRSFFVLLFNTPTPLYLISFQYFCVTLAFYLIQDCVVYLKNIKRLSVHITDQWPNNGYLLIILLFFSFSLYGGRTRV